MAEIILLLILIFAGIAGCFAASHIDSFIRKLRTYGWRKL